MQRIRELSVEAMACRIRRYVPELEESFVCACLSLQSPSGLSELDVHNWVRFFDCMVIDGKEQADGITIDRASE